MTEHLFLTIKRTCLALTAAPYGLGRFGHGRFFLVPKRTFGRNRLTIKRTFGHGRFLTIKCAPRILEAMVTVLNRNNRNDDDN